MNILPEFTTRTWSIIILVSSVQLLNLCFIYLAYKKGQGKGAYYTLPSYTKAAKIGKGLVFHGKAGYERVTTPSWLHDDEPVVKKTVKKKTVKQKKI